MADLMNKTIATIMTALVAVVLLASAFIPTAVNQIEQMISAFTDKPGSTEVNGFAVLMFVVVTMTIIGILISVIRGYTNDASDVYDTITEER